MIGIIGGTHILEIEVLKDVEETKLRLLMGLQKSMWGGLMESMWQ